MKSIILFFTFYSLLISIPMFGQPSFKDEFYKYPLKSITSYCQENPDSIISLEKLTYDKDYKLATRSKFARNNFELQRHVYFYNDSGILLSRDFYVFDETKVRHGKKLYKYDNKNLLIYEGYDSLMRNTSEVYYTYNAQGQLTSASNGKDRYSNTYSYEYDSKNRLIDVLKDNKYFISYEYNNDLLIRETHYIDKKADIKYEYDENGLLLKKVENGKIIEKNIYNNGILIKRYSYYFGIDPCYSLCCSQYITLFEYY